MSSGGAVTALNAHGDASDFLDAVPEVNLFKFTFQRPEKFVKEIIEFPFQGSMQFGRMNTCEINAEAEVMSRTLLKFEFGVMGEGEMYTPEVGHAAIKTVTVTFGNQEGTEIFTADWLHMFNETHVLKDRKEKHHIGMFDSDAELMEWSQTGQANNSDMCEPLYIRVPMYWERDPQQPLPVMCLTEHLPKLMLELRKLEDIAFGSITVDGKKVVDKTGNTKPVAPARLHMSVITERVVFLQPTRRAWTKAVHRYMYDYMQMADFSVDSIRPEYELRFHNAVKEYMFAFQSNLVRQGKKYFVYQTEKVVDGKLYLVPPLIDHQLLYMGNAVHDKQGGWWWHDYMFNEHHSNTPTMTRKYAVPSKEVDGKLVIDWNSPAMDLCKLQQATQAVYCNSFAKAPEEMRPTGSSNWSAIPDIIVKNTVESIEDGVMRMFVKAWNIVTISNGTWHMQFVSGSSNNAV